MQNNFQDLKEEIISLKKEKNAIILAHNYQLPEVQDCANFTGDSLELARKAVLIEEEIIVFCGVSFMAETAAILNPHKTVLTPNTKAGCPLADFATGAQVREWKERYSDYAFVSYINSNAEVKAEVDIVCTSSNAVKVVESVPQDKIVFLPDRNLGSWVAEQTNKEVLLWPGFCVVHERTNPLLIQTVREIHPNALIMAHPECPKEVRDEVDEICSTGQMFGVVEKYPDRKEFVVVTEWGMVHALKKRFPDRVFIEPGHKTAGRMECRNMKKITLEKVRDSLLNRETPISVDSATADRAKSAIDKMLAIK